jgi:hypothetical protein
MVGRTPASAADALVGLLRADAADFVGEKRVQGDPRGPGMGVKISPFAEMPAELLVPNGNFPNGDVRLRGLTSTV